MSSLFGIGGNSASTGFYPFDISQSLRFNAADGAYLEKTFSGTGNRRTFTISFWFKRCRDDTAEYLFAGGDDTSNRFHMDINASGTFQIEAKSGGSTQIKMEGGAVLRDVSAWYHFVLRVDTTQATDSDRVRLYVNGDLLTFNSNTYPSEDADLNWNLNDQVRIGRAGWDTNYFDGYFAEFINVDGSSLAPTNFGETKNGIWIPKDYTGSYGTNGFKLAFQDSSALGDDTSGNGHDFTSTNLASTDQMPDSPTNNFSTFNPLLFNTTPTLQEGNLEASLTSSTGQSGRSRLGSTFHITSGKWYWELTLPGTGQFVGFGISRSGFRYMLHTDPTEGVGFASFQTQSSASVTFYAKDSTGSTAVTSTGPTVTNIIQIALDADDGEMWIGDGTNFYSGDGTGDITGTSGDPAAGTNASFTGLDFSEAWTPMIEMTGSSKTESFLINFGQDSSFTGTETAQGNSDGNGNGDFYYSPPSGFLALCTANLPDPGIDPAADEVPTDYFNTVLYTGTGATQSITGVGFQPDWVWLKTRSGTTNHQLFDSVRGVNKSLVSNATGTEDTSSTNKLTSFDSDGFSLGDNATPNTSSSTYVAWNWKAGGAAASNTDGSITSSVSASTDSGFSIVTYTGTGANATVGHGLSKAPDMIIVKKRANDTQAWQVYHSGNTSAPETDKLTLNTDAATVDDNTTWNDTAPTSTVFSIGTGSGTNENTDTYVAYCFADIDGMVKAGSHVGNGSSDGPFLYTGFRPAFVMFKRTDSTSNWSMFDAAREPTNVNDSMLYANASDAEIANNSGVELDFVSNGIKLRDAPNQFNVSGATYVYLAFAEQPFKYANAR